MLNTLKHVEIVQYDSYKVKDIRINTTMNIGKIQKKIRNIIFFLSHIFVSGFYTIMMIYTLLYNNDLLISCTNIFSDSIWVLLTHLILLIYDIFLFIFNLKIYSLYKKTKLNDNKIIYVISSLLLKIYIVFTIIISILALILTIFGYILLFGNSNFCYNKSKYSSTILFTLIWSMSLLYYFILHILCNIYEKYYPRYW